jgi:hypothetical protein
VPENLTAYDRNDRNSKNHIARDGETILVSMPMMDSVSIASVARLFLGDSFDSTGKSAADIRRAVVQKRLGDAAVADRSDEYLAACFDTLKAMSQAGHPHSSGSSAAVADHRTQANEAHETYVASIRDGWMDQGATATRQAMQTVADATETPHERYVRGLANAWKE